MQKSQSPGRVSFVGRPIDSNQRLVVNNNVPQASSVAPHAENTKAELVMWKPRQSKGVPIQFVIQYLKDSETRTTLYTELMIFIPFLTLFCLFFLGGRNIINNHFVLNAIQTFTMKMPIPSPEFAISKLSAAINEKNFDPSTLDIPPPLFYKDMVKLEHWHMWMESVILPRTWDCVNDNVPRALYQPLGSTFRLGALRIRSLNVRGDTCVPNSNVFTNSSGTKCYNDHKSSAEQTEVRCGNMRNPTNIRATLYTHKTCDEVPGITTTGSRGTYHCGGYIVEVPFNATCASVRQLFQTFQDPTCPFLDPTSTRFIILEWFVYTSPLNSFQSVKLIVEIAPTGGWDVSFQIRSFLLWNTEMYQQTIIDFLVFFYVWYYTSRFFRKWYEDYQRTHRIRSFLTDFWNVLELINILCFFTVFGLRWLWMYESYVAKAVFPFPPTYPPNLDFIQLMFLLQVYLNSLNMVICFMKLLLYLRMNNRMNILTRSMSACAENITGVLALFCVILLAYAIAGYSVFGSGLKSYHTVNSAFATLLQTLLGAFNYKEMYEHAPTVTPFFFWTYQILVLFLLLNFITAILSEGFSQSSRDVALQPLTEVLVRQIESLRHWLHFRNLKKLLELLFQGKSRPVLLRNVVEGLEEHLALLGINDPIAVEKVRMHQEDFKSWLPEELYRDLGDFYMSHVWSDIEYDYETHTSSDLTSSLDKLKRGVTEGVRDICIPPVKRVEGLGSAIEDIELLVRTITAKVETMEDDEMQRDMEDEHFGNNGVGGGEKVAPEHEWKERDWRTMY